MGDKVIPYAFGGPVPEVFSTFMDEQITKTAMIKAMNELQNYADIPSRSIKKDIYSGRPSLEQMLAMRMRWTDNSGALLPVGHLTVAPIDDNKVAVFFTFKGKAITLEDSADLYPSDALITSLRLLGLGAQAHANGAAMATLTQMRDQIRDALYYGNNVPLPRLPFYGPSFQEMLDGHREV